MSEGFFSRGFRGRRRSQDTALPPGKYLVDGFPVLSAGPTPRTPLEEWNFSILGEVDEPKRWRGRSSGSLRGLRKGRSDRSGDGLRGEGAGHHHPLPKLR
jgi:hypothetical protein